MITLSVDLQERGYPVFIGQSLLEDADCFLPYISGEQVLVVTSETIAPLYLKKLTGTLNKLQICAIVLPDGERYKTLNTLNLIFDKLLQDKFNRNCTLIALGGGVVGDITGFAAASYQRGVNFIQVPTTLLAQVDSSVGGKTGVNHPLGKNMIGAFYQPKAVIADTSTLNTLDDRQFSAGMAEVIKYGLIRDYEFLEWLEISVRQLIRRDPACLEHAIERSCANKAEVVAADELESGQRALLNLGHTYGHAIEAGMGYGVWLHGEAVAAGICLAARHSAILGWISEADVERVVNLISSARLPTSKPQKLSIGDMLAHMQVDKKNRNGVIRLVLFKAIGNAIVTGNYPPETLFQALSGSGDTCAGAEENCLPPDQGL